MSYFEVFILPVKTAHMQDYREMAGRAAEIWRALGALEVVEAEGEGLDPGKVTSFPRAVIAEADETVVWSFLRFRDRAHRDAVMEAGMQRNDLMEMMNVDWISGKRMIWGVFGAFVEG